MEEYKMKTLSTILAVMLCMVAFAAGAADPNAHGVHFTNNCPYPIKLAMRYRDMNGDWVTGGWWRFAGREQAYLSRSSTGRRLYTDNGVVYYYAETTRGPRFHWSGNQRKRLGTTVLKMRRKEPGRNKHGDYVLQIKCERHREPYCEKCD
jgi:uncharacterized membrane protein